MNDGNPWRFVEKFPGECAAEVSRKGNAEPCDKPAYAIARNDEGAWPVCIHHARRSNLVPLPEVVEHFGARAK